MDHGNRFAQLTKNNAPDVLRTPFARARKLPRGPADLEARLLARITAQLTLPQLLLEGEEAGVVLLWLSL